MHPHVALEIPFPLEGPAADGAKHHLWRGNVIIFEVVVELLQRFVVGPTLHAADATSVFVLIIRSFEEVIFLDDRSVIFKIVEDFVDPIEMTFESGLVFRRIIGTKFAFVEDAFVEGFDVHLEMDFAGG